MKKSNKRRAFFNGLRASVRGDFRNLNMLDDKSAAAFDAKKIREDWEVVGNDLYSAIEKAKEQEEQNENEK